MKCPDTLVWLVPGSKRMGVPRLGILSGEPGGVGLVNKPPRPLSLSLMALKIESKIPLMAARISFFAASHFSIDL